MDERSSDPWDSLDFELEIRRGDQGGYTAHVLRSPGAGEPESDLSLPWEGEALRKKLDELEDALYTDSETRSSTPSSESRSSARPPEEIVEDFGAQLFRALFTGDIQSSYRIGLNNAKNQRKGLRLKLRVHPSSGLTQVPWEFLYDPSLKRFLVLSKKRPLVRYLSLPRPTEPLRVKPPLRILGMVASPEGLPSLKVDREKRLLEKATERLRKDEKVQIAWLRGQTWEDLEREIRHGQWHIFHFAGHGGFDSLKQEGSLVLADEDGQPHYFKAEKLANLLADSDDLRLVFLNSCEGAKGNESDAFSSAAATLVSKGLAAAVAMQYEVSDEAAIEFSRSFYEAVADGLPVDAAVAAGRTSLSNKVDDTLEWGTPVLYMHSPDGRVFAVQGAEEGLIDQYREAVASVWTNGWLRMRDATWLQDLAGNRLKLAPDTAASIEREVMGNTVESILETQKRNSLRESVLDWLKRNKLSAVVGSLVVVALVGTFVFRQIDPVLEREAVEKSLISHYEKVGNEEYQAAFTDFSEAEQDRRGSAEEYAESLQTWCKDVGADVRDPTVGDIEGDQATATVSVVYQTTCGPLPYQFNTEWTYRWGLIKEDGAWKLHSREEDRLEYTRVPGEVANGGKKLSTFGGGTGNLASISTSNTAVSGNDSCGATFNYDPANVADRQQDTAWQVGGTGVGQWIELRYDEPIKVKRVGIVPGYDKKDRCDGTNRFYQYYVVRKAKIEFSDGSEVTVDFQKKPDMKFKDVGGHETSSLRVTILDVYKPGDKPGGSSFDYEDTGTFGKAAIAEIKVEEM